MIITYLGNEFVKIQHADTVVAVNPVSKTSDFKEVRFGADIAIISNINDVNVNGVEMVSSSAKTPFVIDGAGEYEVKGLFVKGFAIENKEADNKDESNKIITVYLLTLEGISMCFLGGIQSKELPQKLISEMGELDVLFVPIGGVGNSSDDNKDNGGVVNNRSVINATDAYKLAVKLEPKIIIPIHYNEKSDELKRFLKEGGDDKIKPLDRLTLKKSTLAEKEGEIIVLSI